MERVIAHSILVAALCVLFVTSAGCGTKPTDPAAAKLEKPVGGVGVVDLDLVAKGIGRDIEMNQAVQERVTSLNNHLASLQGALRRQYDEKRDKFGEDATDEQIKELQSSENLMERQ